ncbi:MAG: response regulator [Chloroflexi bacterium]|nr:response regulator [Chloroflexota bacterium]
MRVLMIDDEPVFYKMASSLLKKKGYELEYAKNGKDGLAAISAFKPEIIIVDMRLPDLSGFDILQSLRSDPLYHHIPVIFLTSVNTLEDKLKAFELGADDYLIKPFEPEELAARLDILARRAKALQITSELESSLKTYPTVVTLHSLRGGSGVSNLAVNLAISFYQIWEKPTLLLDTAFFAGQIAMLLNKTPGNTLGKFADFQLAELDDKMIDDLINKHESGVHFIAAPRFPVATDVFTIDFWNLIFEKLNQNYSFIVIDTSHDFSDTVISTLMVASTILLVMAPEMGSLRVAVSALKIYDQLSIPAENVKLVLNRTFPNPGIDKAQLEKAIGRSFDYEIPYEPVEVLRSINLGKPFVVDHPELPISKKVEDMSYGLSADVLKYIPPPVPSKAWKRVTSRLPAAAKKT